MTVRIGTARVIRVAIAIGLFAVLPCVVAAADGAALYVRKCGICHDAGGPGTAALARRLPVGVSALLAERSDLSALLVKTVVRNGIGGMQRFNRIELTDAELQAVADHLTRPR